MNEIIQSLLDRKSVRAYTDQEISEENVQLILNAAMQAPTAGNQQLYTILRITDPKKKHRLSISCDNQPFIEQARLVLVFFSCPAVKRPGSASHPAPAARLSPGGRTREHIRCTRQRCLWSLEADTPR